MLLLRAVVGIAVLLEGMSYVGQANPTPASWFIGLAALVAGGLLLTGYLTPIIAAVVGVGALAVGVSLLPACTPSVFDGKPSLVFALTILLTVIGLGPGAFSVDARAFGRREIIIPPPIDLNNRINGVD